MQQSSLLSRETRKEGAGLWFVPVVWLKPSQKEGWGVGVVVLLIHSIGLGSFGGFSATCWCSIDLPDAGN